MALVSWLTYLGYIFQMILIILFVILALPCFAVRHSSNVNNAPRWIDLSRQIYDESGPAIEITRLRTILMEISAIESTEAFRVGLRPLIESGDYPIYPFKELVQRYNKTVFLNNSDATITDLLLRTFDHDSNDCTADYFEMLVDIYKHMDNRPIAEALQHNRELQYKNCWRRLMNILQATSLLLGSNVTNRLNDLATLVYPNKILSFKPPQMTSVTESKRVSQIVTEYLRGHKIEYNINNYINNFLYLLKKPCKLLVDATKNVMSLVWDIEIFSPDKRNSIGDDDDKLLLTHSLCNRILADQHLILSNLLHSTIVKSGDSKDGRQPVSSDTLYGQTEGGLPMEEKISTDLRLSQPIDDKPDDLITQDLPFVAGPSNEHSTKHPESLHQLAVVESVLDNVGKATASRFLTKWSDGSETFERRQYLQDNWPEQLKAFLRKRNKGYQSKYINSIRLDWAAKVNSTNPSDATDQQPPTKRRRVIKPVGLSNPETSAMVRAETGDIKEVPVVISVDRCVGRGAKARYPTLWSDGKITHEEKSYLQSQWPNEWSALLKSLSSLNYNRYINRGATKFKPKPVPTKYRPIFKQPVNPNHLQLSTAPEVPISSNLPFGYYSTEPSLGYTRQVVRVGHEIVEGTDTKYQTSWSDGSESLESGEYLMTHWAQAWNSRQKSQ